MRKKYNIPLSGFGRVTTTQITKRIDGVAYYPEAWAYDKKHFFALYEDGDFDTDFTNLTEKFEIWPHTGLWRNIFYVYIFHNHVPRGLFSELAQRFGTEFYSDICFTINLKSYVGRAEWEEDDKGYDGARRSAFDTLGIIADRYPVAILLPPGMTETQFRDFVTDQWRRIAQILPTSSTIHKWTVLRSKRRGYKKRDAFIFECKSRGMTRGQILAAVEPKYGPVLKNGTAIDKANYISTIINRELKRRQNL